MLEGLGYRAWGFRGLVRVLGFEGFAGFGGSGFMQAVTADDPGEMRV